MEDKENINIQEYNSILKIFATLLGYLNIVCNIKTYEKTKKDYLYIKTNIEKWLDHFIKNKNFNIITYENSLELHKIIDDKKEEILFDKNIGEEKIISDEILIVYEILMKKINLERRR